MTSDNESERLALSRSERENGYVLVSFELLGTGQRRRFLRATVRAPSGALFQRLTIVLEKKNGHLIAQARIGARGMGALEEAARKVRESYEAEHLSRRKELYEAKRSADREGES